MTDKIKEKKERPIKTKNYNLYFSIDNHWKWMWCLPCAVNIESLDKDYFEIDFSFLFLTFSFTAVSHNFAREVEKMTKKNNA